MKVITLKETVLNESNIPEGLYQGVSVEKYNPEIPYSLGAIIYYTDTTPHQVYESQESSNTGNTPPDNPSKWQCKGATDRYLMFDRFLTTQSPGVEEFEIVASGCNAIGLFNLVAKNAEFTVVVGKNFLSGSYIIEPGWTDNLDDTFGCDGTQVDLSKLYQDGSTLEGTMYQVQFIMSGYVAGNIAGLVGGVTGDNVSGNGRHTQFITAGTISEDGLVADSEFIGTISGLNIRRVAKQEFVSLNLVDINNTYDYCFAPFNYKNDIVWNFPQYSNSTIRVKLTWKESEPTKCGVARVGRSRILGKSQWDFSVGINDYSQEDTDDDTGETYLDQRNYSKKIDISAWIPNDAIDLVNDELTNNRGVAAIYDFNENDTDWQGLVVYGFYQTFKINVPGKNQSRCVFDIKGLT